MVAGVHGTAWCMPVHASQASHDAVCGNIIKGFGMQGQGFWYARRSLVSRAHVHGCKRIWTRVCMHECRWICVCLCVKARVCRSARTARFCAIVSVCVYVCIYVYLCTDVLFRRTKIRPLWGRRSIITMVARCWQKTARAAGFSMPAKPHMCVWSRAESYTHACVYVCICLCVFAQTHDSGDPRVASL